MITRISSALVVLALVGGGLPATKAAEPVHWIWQTNHRQADQQTILSREFTLEELPTRAEWFGLADYCYSRVLVNEVEVARAQPYAQAESVEVADHLQVGTNRITVECRGIAKPAALMGRLSWQTAAESHAVVTDTRWQAREREADAWQPAVSLGEVEASRYGLDQPSITITATDDYTQWKRAIDAQQGTDPNSFETAPGFEVDLLHSATEEEGSWVSLTADPTGGWIIGIEKQGLLHLSLGEQGEPAQVTRVNDTLHECRGLQFKENWLYALANNDKALYRLTERNDRGEFTSVDKLMEFTGSVGHGRNQLTLDARGNLYGIMGDAVDQPPTLDSLPPARQRQSSAEQTHNGFVVKFAEEIEQSQILVRGLRNPYGIAINEQGDMFTYDADAEYDMGASWYRPTRVLHLLPGADYRWRRVTKRWPPYFPDQADMPQVTLDIGKGSPTAVVFGSGENFPPQYRRALFILDWAYGRIVAVHLTPRGSSYYATPETFLRGAPLNVTDLEFGPEGAMYFVTGGRGTQSALYRVRYTGVQPDDGTSTQQQLVRQAHAKTSHATRKQLHEYAAGANASNLPAIRRSLDSQDPWIRHAARTALEALPQFLCQQQVRAVDKPAARLAVLMATIRTADNPPVEFLAEQLIEHGLSSLTERLQLEWLFLAEQLLSDRFELPDDLRHKLFAQLAVDYPSQSWKVNRHLSLLLAEEPPQQFVETTMQLLDQATSPTRQFHYMFVLRHAQRGWSPELRMNYFRHLQRLGDHVGGEGMPTFRKLIREEALAAVPEQARPQFEAMLKQAKPDYLAELPSEPRELVQHWKLTDFTDDPLPIDSDRDLEGGRRVFATAACIGCHRIGNRGDTSGPDLTAVARRFSLRDMLISLLEPSRVIAEKYASHSLEMSDGRIITGQIAAGDYRSAELVIVPNLLEPEKTVRVNKAEIVQQRLSPTSPMPAGLLDTFTREEILDLIAYLSHGQR